MMAMEISIQNVLIEINLFLKMYKKLLDAIDKFRSDEIFDIVLTKCRLRELLFIFIPKAYLISFKSKPVKEEDYCVEAIEQIKITQKNGRVKFFPQHYRSIAKFINHYLGISLCLIKTE